MPNPNIVAGPVGGSADETFACTVSANNVYQDVVAVVEWTRNGVAIDSIIIPPTIDSSQYNIRETIFRAITMVEGEYACSSYLTTSSSNQYVLDSDTSAENVTTCTGYITCQISLQNSIFILNMRKALFYLL